MNNRDFVKDILREMDFSKNSFFMESPTRIVHRTDLYIDIDTGTLGQYFTIESGELDEKGKPIMVTEPKIIPLTQEEEIAIIDASLEWLDWKQNNISSTLRIGNE